MHSYPSSIRKRLRRGRKHAWRLVALATNENEARTRLLRDVRFSLAGAVSPIIAADFRDISYFVSTRDQGISRTVYREGSYEQELMAHSLSVLEEVLGRGPILAGKTFVDVANIGTSTILALRVFGANKANNAVSFEPEPGNFTLLGCNVALNGFEDRVRLFSVALSDRAGTAPLERDPTNWGDHRIRMANHLPDGIHRESSRPVVDVPLMRFDDACVEMGLDIDSGGVVWMDVQGHEGHVLAGAPSLLVSDDPIVMEYCPYGLDRSGGKELLYDLLEPNYQQVIDLRTSWRAREPRRLEVSELRKLESSFHGETFTDLILLK